MVLEQERWEIGGSKYMRFLYCSRPQNVQGTSLDLRRVGGIFVPLIHLSLTDVQFHDDKNTVWKMPPIWPFFFKSISSLFPSRLPIVGDSERFWESCFQNAGITIEFNPTV